MWVHFDALKVQLPVFEGPLALLLYLIRKQQIPLEQVDLQQITHRYLYYVEKLQEWDMDVASEFIEMASYLIYLKSLYLLGQSGFDDTDDDQFQERQQAYQQARQALIEKLAAYERYQKLARWLKKRPMMGRDFISPQVLPESFELDSSWQQYMWSRLKEGGVYRLIETYWRLKKRQQNSVRQITVITTNVAEKLRKARTVWDSKSKWRFREWIHHVEKVPNVWDILTTFLMFLELAKLGYVRLYQWGLEDDFDIELLRPLDEGVRIDDDWGQALESLPVPVASA